MRSLLFGQEVQGRKLGTGQAYKRATAEDGTTHITVGDWSDTGTSTIEGNLLCIYYPSEFRFCASIFRNPGGIFAEKNEYLLFTQWDRFEFSVVK
jgi:adenylate cyclase